MGRSAEEKPGGQNMVVVFGATFVSQFVQALAVAVVVAMQADRGNGQLGTFDGIFIGLLVGIGFAAAASLGHRLFAGQNFKVWAIEVGADVVCLTAMAIIISLWR
jgi:RsiW-degrading membrane proteinase PrsW (M82 family)